MEQENAQSVLRRLLRGAGEAVVSSAVTPTRALRLAMARAAEATVGLNLSVLGVTEENMPLDEALKAIAPGGMLLALGRDGMPVGLAVLDLQLRTATVEMQTIGILRPDVAAERKITKADAALCAPLVTGFLEDLARTSEDTSLEGWADGVEAGAILENTREASMILQDCAMRLVRLSLEFGGGERQGELCVVLANGRATPSQKPAVKPPDFSHSLRKSVMEAPAQVHAVLHRMQLTLRDVERFEVGQVVALPGVTVGSVRLEGPDGACVGRARLGQVTGLRAVRIEEAAPRQMTETAMVPHLAEAVAVADALDVGDMDAQAAMMPMADAGVPPFDLAGDPGEDGFGAAPSDAMMPDPAAAFGDGGAIDGQEGSAPGMEGDQDAALGDPLNSAMAQPPELGGFAGADAAADIGAEDGFAMDPMTAMPEAADGVTD